MKKLVLFLLPLSIFFFLYNILIHPVIFPPYSDAAVYKLGTIDSAVMKIEERLKWLGYLQESPDCYYGSDTKEAVKKFQMARKLKITGDAGYQTLEALGVAVETNNASRKKNSLYNQNSEVSLLGRLINGEARGEPYAGQVAVGAVIMNRTRDPRFPHTISGVIYQPGAFTAVSDGQINAPAEVSPLKAAQDAINGWDPTGGCIFYYNPAKTTNKWIWSRPVVKVIGSHYFCK